MFIRRPPTEPSPLEVVIAEATNELLSHAPFTEEYDSTLEKIERLTAIQQTKLKRVSPDTWVVVGSNVFLGLAALHYEKAGVITSKVWTTFVKAAR